MTHTGPRITVLLTGLLLSGLLSAQEPTREPEEERWYQVELILFLNQTGGLASREEWPRDTGVPVMEGAVGLEPVPVEAAGLVPFQALREEELELHAAYRKLERSPHYKPLLHMGWRQPFAENQEEFIPLKIRAPLNPELDALPASGSEATPTVPTDPNVPAGTAPIWSVEQVAAPKPLEGIEGTVKLRVARYLHFDVDLLYQKELPLLPETAAKLEGSTAFPTDNPAGVSPTATTTGSPFFGGLMADFSGLPSSYYQGYRMTEQRRLRREEVHYFDHPKFGLLVKVAAYEPPPPEVAPTPPPATQPSPTTSTPALPVPVAPTGKATTQPLR